MLLTRGTAPPSRRTAAVWHRQRPTGSAVLIMAAGAWLIVLPFLGTPLALLQAGVAGSAGLGVSLPLLLCGVVLLRFPFLHALTGVAATALSVLALLTCNFGGLLLGTVCGILGGCLAFSWTPPKPSPPVSGAPPGPAEPRKPV
ncbi:DUF6114 domain-containing protein [Streptomyces macrosporus]|uniref:Uncharacterized protein n=1 Tax=Streptomyces macrosporus TaxID=44032 RepID=A0ABP5XT48_9ACTN